MESADDLGHPSPCQEKQLRGQPLLGVGQEYQLQGDSDCRRDKSTIGSVMEKEGEDNVFLCAEQREMHRKEEPTGHGARSGSGGLSTSPHHK